MWGLQAKLQAALAFCFPRMGLWLWSSAVLVVAVYMMAGHMAQVVVFKLALLTLSSYVGYWISRSLERGRRPHELKTQALILREEGKEARADQLEEMARSLLMRRTIIVAAAMVAAAIGG